MDIKPPYESAVFYTLYGKNDYATRIVYTIFLLSLCMRADTKTYKKLNSEPGYNGAVDSAECISDALS